MGSYFVCMSLGISGLGCVVVLLLLLVEHSIAWLSRSLAQSISGAHAFESMMFGRWAVRYLSSLHCHGNVS